MTSIQNTLLQLLMCLSLVNGFSQEYHLDSLTVLSTAVPESSGLLYYQGRTITHNDSGGEPVLYELDTLNGTVSREVYLANATNIDWEDITADENHLYIADIGNNFGNRTDLRIYRVNWSDYLLSDTVVAQIIDYAYADQEEFISSQYTTPYDAEALIAIADSLYLFTKDWSAPRTKVYAIPKHEGSHTVTAVDSFAVPALITGVDLSPTGGRLLFSAYTGTEAIILTLQDFTTPYFSQGELQSWSPSLTGSFKMEGICWSSERFAFISTEKVGMAPSVLYRLDTDFTDALPFLEGKKAIHVYPQPAFDQIFVEGEGVEKLSIYNSTGNYLGTSRGRRINVAALVAGPYWLVIELSNEEKVVRPVTIIK